VEEVGKSLEEVAVAAVVVAAGIEEGEEG